jgi:hypothetical protein
MTLQEIVFLRFWIIVIDVVKDQTDKVIVIVENSKPL